MAKARWNVSADAPDTDDPGHHPGHRDRLGQGRRRQVVGHRQPGRRAGRHGLHRRRARRRHLGLLRPPHARRRGRLGGPSTTATSKIVPTRARVGAGPAQGRVDGLPRRRRGDGADVARPHAQPGRPAVPRGRRAGATSTTCSSTCRPAPATCRWAWPGMLPRAEMIIVTTPARRRPEGRRPRRRHGPQELPAGRRRDREHERVHLRARRRRTRCSASGGGAGAGRRGRRAAARSDPARAGGRRRRRRRRAGRAAATVRPPTPSGPSPTRIVDEAVPPVAMAGCSARMLDAAVAALDAKDAAEAASATTPARPPPPPVADGGPTGSGRTTVSGDATSTANR